MPAASARHAGSTKKAKRTPGLGPQDCPDRAAHDIRVFVKRLTGKGKAGQGRKPNYFSEMP